MSKTLVFSQSYEDVLKSSKPVKKDISKKDFKLMRSGADQIGISLLPPLNTSILFKSVLPKFRLPPKFKSMRVPDNFDWSKISPSDSEIIKAKKKLITPVQNQGLCGSCWAVATSNCISDVFVVSGKVDKNPMLSPTYLMSCNFNNEMMGCDGGNPAVTCKAVSKNGITPENCSSYDLFCNSTNGCRSSKGAEAHFEADSKSMNQYLQNLGCGCVNPDLKHKLFFITLPTVHDRSENDESSNPDIVKQHIFQNGPVIAGFHVYNNFRNGNYSGTNGVYLENYRYDVDGNATYDPNQTDPSNWIGGHAVVVIGWGSTIINDNKVNYWIARNSWGENWGDGGYFKMAMYGSNPKFSNQVSQFDKAVIIEYSYNQRAQAGGMISFRTADIKEETLEPLKIPSDNPEADNKIFNEEFTVNPLKIKGSNGPKPSPVLDPETKKCVKLLQSKGFVVIKDPFYQQTWFQILMIIIVIYLLYKLVNKNKSQKLKFNNRFLYSMDY